MKLDFLAINLFISCNIVTVNTTLICDFQLKLSNGNMVIVDASNSIGNISNYSWNWGDGSTIFKTNLNSTTHTYLAIAKSYSISLIITSSMGTTATKSLSVDVMSPPVSRFFYLTSGNKVVLNRILSSSYNSKIVSYMWDFGDGSFALNSSQTSVSRFYAYSKLWLISLTVSNQHGFSSSFEQYIRSPINLPPISIFRILSNIDVLLYLIVLVASILTDKQFYIYGALVMIISQTLLLVA